MAKVSIRNEHMIYFYCPGCGEEHWVNLQDTFGGSWAFNGDLEHPTIRPSVHLLTRDDHNNLVTLCHSFVTDGTIQFLGDCPHVLAGQTVDLPEMEE